MRLVVTCIMLLFVIANVSLADTVNVDELIKTTQSWNGISLPDYSDKETEVTVLKIQIAPKTKLPMHFHPVINVAYMLSGELTVISQKGEKKVIKKGDPLVELVNQAHYGINKGDIPVEILVVYIGKQGEPITIKE